MYSLLMPQQLLPLRLHHSGGTLMFEAVTLIGNWHDACVVQQTIKLAEVRVAS
jgi:hypothetical protein